MNRRRSAGPALASLLVAGFVAALLAGCGGSGTSAGGGKSAGGAAGSTAAAGGGGMKVGLALNGPRFDNSFNQAAYEGLLEAKRRFGLRVSVVDNLDDPEAQQRGMLNLAADNQLVLAGSGEFGSAVNAAAARFPKTTFAVPDFVPNAPANVRYSVQDWTPLGYLAGYVAARLSKTGTVGFVGGSLIPPTTQGRTGFELGAKAADPRVKVLTTIVGTFSDPVKGKNAASAQIANGADVLYSFLDAGHPGVIQAIKASGKPVKIIGVISPKCGISAGLDIGDTVQNLSSVIFGMVRDFRAKKLRNTTYGVAPGIATLRLCPAYRRPALARVIGRLTARLQSGSIRLPRK